MVRFISGVILFALFIAMMSMGGGYLYDTTSLALVILISLGSLMLAYGAEAFTFLKLAFQKSLASENVTGEQAVHFFTTWSRLTINAGAASTLIGVVAILSNMDDPAFWGAATAVALLTLLYAIMFNLLIVFTFKQRVLERFNYQLSPADDALRLRARVLNISVVALTLLVTVTSTVVMLSYM